MSANGGRIDGVCNILYIFMRAILHIDTLVGIGQMEHC